MTLHCVLASVLGIALSILPSSAQDVVISEIMYNPPSANPAEEWIELHNRGTGAVNLAGWRISDGVAYTFGDVTIPAGGYLVVAADTEVFNSLYPSVSNYVGGWLDTLSNNGEGVELQDAAGEQIDRVRYATEGSWGMRRRLPDPNTGTPGWDWTADHDGIGKSVELINPAVSNDSGQNWAPSNPVGGTPGTVNSVVDTDIAPMILDVGHTPLVPRSGDSVTITARVMDEQTSGVVVELFYRNASSTTPPTFSMVTMFDDGAHNDGGANDGVFAAVAPAFADQTVIEFYVRATDGGSNARTYPAPAINQLGQPAQTVNMMYQVDDSIYEGTQPFYRVILTEAERLELQNINRNSDAEMNCTFVTVDGIETQVRHNCGIRIRGAGSRGAAVPNHRLNIPNDNLWKGLEAINLNSQFPHAQLVGGAVAQKAGMAAADARVIQLRINGRNLATAGSPQFGSYVAVEPINADFAENHFPQDPDGNVYRASTGNHTADLSYRSSASSLMSAGYSKTSNTSENDWSDLINLTFVLNNTPNETYTLAVEQVANVRQWMKYFAVITMMAYGETALGTGRGDDYAMYRGISDQRFLLLAHDFDTIFGQGGGGAIGQNIFIANGVPAVARFLTWPDFVPIYYEELLRMSETAFAPEQLFPTFDRLLRGWVPDATITAMKVFATNRTAYVRSQIPLSLTVSTNGLRIVDGEFTSTNNTVGLSGFGNVVRSRSIRVNGALATWQPVGGRWTNLVSLLPGVNRVLVQAFDVSGVEFERSTIDIVYDDGTIGVIPSPITVDTTLTAAGGPYEVTSAVTVAAGATLTIEPGTTFYMEDGAGFQINGRLVAQGTETRRIRFTSPPGTSFQWGGIRFSNTTNDNRLTHADIENSGAGDSIVLINSTLLIDNVTWTGTTRTIIDLSNSSLICRNSTFPTIVNNETIHGVGMPPNGYVIIESNWFGGTTGYSDIIDFTGGKRPGPILQVLNNIFNGGSDDGLDLDGTDAHIEGNLFRHIHQDDPFRDSASHAIATDFDAEITVARNIFFDNDHAVLLKNGAFLTAENNTFVNCTVAVISFDETNRNVNPGQGAVLDGCIFWNNGALFRNLYLNHPVETNTELTLVRSLVQGTNHPGIGNINAEPLFVNYTNDFRLRSGSPAIGTGPNGLDMGAHVPGGASIAGEPPAITPQTSTTLTVDGPGITHYRYRLNNGAFGPEQSVTTPISLTGLSEGSYRVTVIGKNSAGVWEEPANGAVSRLWSVNSSVLGVRINEVLARNDSAVPVGNEFPDLVELYNAGTSAVDLSGMGITDDAGDPFKFIFPEGTTLGAGQYLVLYADNEPGAGIHLGFGLSQDGDEVLLFRGSGTLVDQVTFGVQIADRSIGRRPDNSWGLTQPTFGAANIVLPTADARALKINEWLASPGGLLNDDGLELYNALPVAANFGGAYLTDAPQHAPTRHVVTPLSFVPAHGFVALIADGNTNRGANHLNFKLSGDQGEIGLFASDLSLIDCVVYGPQVSGISEGRIPSGANTFGAINPPTLGGPNPGSIVEPTNIVVSLSSLASGWRYEATGTDLGTAWRATDFNDSGWPVGNALLGREPDALPAPGIQTLLSLNDSGGQQIITYYFRQRVVISSNLADFRLSATTAIDDGAVVYINGQEALRIRMPNGFISYDTQALPPSVNNASLESWTLPATNLVIGTNVIAVEVHQAQLPSSDIVFGLALEASRTFTNSIPRPVTLNEVLANNGSVPIAGQTNVTDWVELVNTSGSVADLSDMSLSDDSANARRWVFPPGVTVPAGGYLLVRFDATLPVSTNSTGILNTGFGLSAGGDAVYLFDKASRGGGLLDSIVFGIQATDYSVGLLPNPTSGTWQLNLPTPGTANVAANVGTPLTLKINEWLARPSGNDEDYFEIYNPNNQPVALGGLWLTDDVGEPDQYRIPNLSFVGAGPDGFVRFVADNDPEAGADHVNFGLSADGETIALFTANGIQIDAVSFGPQSPGVSEGRFPDGAAEVERFAGTPTPGASNLRLLSGIVVSEVLTHTDAPLEDAIELQNISPGAIDISGWWLSDQRNDPKRFRIPPGTVLQPGGFAVFYEYQFNSQPGIYPSFSLSSVRGDEVFLFTANADGNLTGFRTGEDFGPAANGVSFGRYQSSIGFDFTAMSSRTFGEDNPASTNQFRLGIGRTNAFPLVGPVVIDEIMYHPPPSGTNDNSQDEFIELHNRASTNVALFSAAFPTNTWRLRDAVDFNFPQGVTMPGGSYLLVVGFNPSNSTALNAFRARYGLGASVPIYGPYDGRLDNGGENVELYRPDVPQPIGTPDAGFVPHVEVDRVKYADANPWPSAADTHTNGVGASLQRRIAGSFGNDPVNWLAGVPTPGAATGAALVAPPNITGQPSSQTVGLNGSATFNVTASGGAPWSYQWRLNGVDIAGATNASYTVMGAQLAQSGAYSARVVNSAGAALSASATLTVQAPPLITQQPQSRSVAAGSTAVFTVAAQGTAPLRYQWQREGQAIAGATGATLIVSNVQMSSEGSYSVVVSNNFGSVTSLLASLSISAIPVITMQPQPTNVFVGATVSFSVGVSGSLPLVYQWRFNNVNIPGATGATLVLDNVQTTNTGNYSVLVTNNVGATLSSPALLTVSIPPIITITATDANASEPGANAGAFLVSRTGGTAGSVLVGLDVTGSATAGADYQSLPNQVLIPSGSSSASLVVTPIDDDFLEGDETVIVTVVGSSEYVVGSQSSATVTIFDEDNVAPSVTITNPVAGSRFNAGVEITVSASATDSDGAIGRVRFFYDATNSIGEVLAAPYTIIWSNAPSGAHVLTAVAIDNLGSSAVSAPVPIEVNRMPVVTITSPTNGASFFAPAQISIAATASDPDGSVTNVQFFSGTNLISSDSVAPYTGSLSGVPAGTYVLTARAFDNQGTPGVSAAVTVTVNEAPPRFDDMFANRGVITGFTNFITGNNSTYTKEAGEPRHDNKTGGHSAWIQWIAPGSGTCTIDTFGSDFDTVLAVYRGTSVSALTFVASNDDFDISTLQSRVTFSATAGTAYVIAVDGYGAPDFGSIQFRLNLPNPNPVITQHPTSQVVNQGANVTFAIAATGPPPLRYQWFFSGAGIANATNTTLILTNVRGTNDGVYRCVVSNATGFAVSSNATLTVRVPPSIVTQPAAQTVNRGGTATFTVGVSGTAPFTYQWRFNGASLAGRTNATLVLNDVQYTNGGNYSVSVANAVGTTVSQAAELIVRPTIVSARRLGSGIFELNLHGTPNRSYVIEASTNSLTGWTNLTTVNHSGVSAQHNDTTAPQHPKRYYRLRLAP